MAYKDNPENDDANTASLLGMDVLSISVVCVLFVLVMFIAVW